MRANTYDVDQGNELAVAICVTGDIAEDVVDYLQREPWRFRDVTRAHAGSSATQLSLQIGLFAGGPVRRETTHVSFRMCPFCVREASPKEATLRPVGGTSGGVSSR